MYKLSGKQLINWKTAIMAVVFMLAFQGTSMAVLITWTGGTGNWNNATNWSPGGLPNAASDVLIDNFPGGPSSVTLDISTTIDTLTIEAFDSLNFNNSRDLTIAGGGVINDGTINLNSTASLTDFNLHGSTSLSGTGEVVMGNNANNQIRTDGTTVTQGAGHTIRGAGQLLANTGNMINNGTVRQEGTVAMTIDPNATFTNQGTMQATGTGGFVFGTGTFTNTGQTIDVQTGSKLDLNTSVIIDGGTLQTAGTGTINQLGSGVGATLNNVTIAGTVTQNNSSDTTITGGLTNNGTWNLNSTGSQTDMNFNGGITLGGTGEIVMSDNASLQNNIKTDNTILTQAAGHTIRGTGNLLSNNGGMVNNGTIRQEGVAAMKIDPNGLGFTNNATMQATGAGGFVFNPGTFTNTGQTIDIQTGSKLDLNTSVIIDGGTLQTAGTGTINQLGSGVGATLNNVTIAGTVTQANAKDTTITGSLTNNGTWNLNATSSPTDLNFNGGITLGGTGEIVMSDSLLNDIRTDATTLTQAAGHTIRGAGQLLLDTGGMINNGTIIQEGTVAMKIDPSALGFTNQGTMQATGTGGFVFGSGTFTNTGQTIDIQTGSKLDMGNLVTVNGGTLQTVGTGTINQLGSGTGATLNNVTIEGTVTQTNGNDTTITGGLTNNGTWNLNSAGSPTDLFFNGGITLGGTGEIVMSDNLQNNIRTDATTLTQAAGHTIRGAGQLLLNTGGMINNGTIIQEGTVAMKIDPSALGFTNQGTMQATGSGGFNFAAGTFTNTGQTIDIQTGSKLDMGNLVTVNGGTLQTAGTGTINQLGSGVGATLNNVTIAGTVAQANSLDSTVTGSLTNNGTWNLNSTGSQTDLNFNGGAVLDGTGKIVMSNNIQNRIRTDGSTMTQGANHTIEGAGNIIAAMTNNGTVNANQTAHLQLSTNNKTNNGLMKASNGGTLNVIASVDIDGTGSWEANGGSIVLNTGVNVTTTGNVDILNGGSLTLTGATMMGNNMNLTDVGSSISVNSGIELSSNFLYDITNEADSVWGGSSFLKMTGFNSFLELGGEDFGTDPVNHVGTVGGFTLNFDLTELIIGDGAKLHFADFFDNGNRIEHGFGTSEALYVDTLTLDGTGILNLNSLNLYYTNLNLLNGATIDQIIDEVAPPLGQPVPEPSTIALLGIGLAGLGGMCLKRRFKGKAKS